MRCWRLPLILLLVTACSSDNETGPGDPPDVPADLFSITLDGAVALTWPDNAFISGPDNFLSYRVYSTSYNIDAPQNTDPCGTSWELEGTTVAPEFLVGAMVNGVSRCFSVTAASPAGVESGRSKVVFDTPRPHSRNQVLYAIQVNPDSSGFRFWDDDGDNLVEDGELGRVRDGTLLSVDFYVDRVAGHLFLTPSRPGTGVEFYALDPVSDLTSIDDAPCLGTDPNACSRYSTAAIEAGPGIGYVFEMEAGDAFLRYGSVRVTPIGIKFPILDRALLTAAENPELLVGRRAAR